MYHEAVAKPDPGRGWRRLALWLPPVLLSGLYLPGLVGGRIHFLRDIGSHELGWCRIWVRSVLDGCLPLWDALTLGGSPMLANPNTLSLYPPMTLFLVLPTPTALAVFLLGHQLLLGLGTGLLLRRLKLPRMAILAGAVATAGSGIAFSQAAFLTGPAALAWLPFLLASAIAPSGSSGLGRGRIAEAAAAGALMLLAGKPAVALLGWALWGVILLAGGSGWQGLARAAAAPLLAAALAAPLLLPGLEVLSDSWRSEAGTSAAAVEADSFAPRRWPELLLPRLYGRPSPALPGGFWAAPSFPWQRYLLDLHLGSIPFLLLLLSGRRKEARPWLFAAGALVLLAAFPPLLRVLRQWLPFLHLLRFAIKCLIPAAVVLAPPVALGARAAPERPGSFRKGAFVLALPLLLLLIPALWPGLLRSLLGGIFPASAANLALPGVCRAVARDLRLDLVAALLPLAAAAWSPRRLLVPAMAVQLLLGGAWMLTWDSWERWKTPPPAADLMGPRAAVLELYQGSGGPPTVPFGEDPVRWHYRRLRNGLARYYGVLWGVSYRGISGPDGIEPAWMRVLAARFRQADPLAAARAARHVGAGWLITDRELPEGVGGSGRYPIPGGPEGAAAYRLDARLPAVWLAREVLSVPSEAALWSTLTDVETEPGVQAVVVASPGVRRMAPGGCRLLSRRTGEWYVEVESQGPGLLVVDQAASPLWRASTETGIPLPTLRVNGFLLGVRTPPGHHRVRLSVSSRRFLQGLGLFLPALLITALLAVGAPTRGPRTPTGAEAPTLRASPPVQ